MQDMNEIHLQTGLIRVGGYSVIVESDHVLLVRFDNEYGIHYNFPGGGHHPGETIEETVARETLEETSAAVAIGRLLLVAEYAPFKVDNIHGPYHKLGLLYSASRMEGSEPRLPDKPDPDQVGVDWVPLAGKSRYPVLPEIRPAIRQALDSGTVGYLLNP